MNNVTCWVMIPPPPSPPHGAVTMAAADTSLPVLGGVDVVAYWALPEGSVSVLGTADLVGLFRDYRFFFSSIENLRTFEVRVT